MLVHAPRRSRRRHPRRCGVSCAACRVRSPVPSIRQTASGEFNTPTAKGGADWFTQSADAVWRIRLGGRGVNLSDAVWRIRFHGARWSILEDLERATTPGEVAYGDRLCSGRPAPAPRGKDGKREYQSGLSSRRRPSSSTAPGSAASAR